MVVCPNSAVEASALNTASREHMERANGLPSGGELFLIDYALHPVKLPDKRNQRHVESVAQPLSLIYARIALIGPSPSSTRWNGRPFKTKSIFL